MIINPTIEPLPLHQCDGEQIISEANLPPVAIETRLPTMAIRSIDIAERLCCDYPHFRDLLSIPVDKTDPDRKRHVWIFKKTDELMKAFLEIVDERKAVRLKIQQLTDSGVIDKNNYYVSNGAIYKDVEERDGHKISMPVYNPNRI